MVGTTEQAVHALNQQIGGSLTTIEQAINYDHPIYRIEEDNPEDEVDWDWMES